MFSKIRNINNNKKIRHKNFKDKHKYLIIQHKTSSNNINNNKKIKHKNCKDKHKYIIIRLKTNKHSINNK
jgi:hypothetical protein